MVGDFKTLKKPAFSCFVLQCIIFSIREDFQFEVSLGYSCKISENKPKQTMKCSVKTYREKHNPDVLGPGSVNLINILPIYNHTSKLIISVSC